MNPCEVVIIQTGIANLASVLAGLRRVGATARLSDDPSDVANAQAVVLPGVGAFASGMETLTAARLAEPLRDRIAQGRPTLAVCLGLQLLCASSEESPGTPGLGAIDGSVKRFTGNVRVPQLGWNRVVPSAGNELVEAGFAYFANSFRLGDAPDGWSCAMADHAGPFVAAMERGAVLACQFHPELSGPWGLALLKRWIDRAMQQGGKSC
jgi:imidazole glycerol phosphate synthase glutamine amidotransferase subunit